MVEGTRGHAAGRPSARLGVGGEVRREVQRRGGEHACLHGAGQPGDARRADLGPVRAVGRVVPGDHVARAGQPQPARRRRRHRPGQARNITGVVVLHAHAVAAGGHHRGVGRSGPGAAGDDDPGLGPRHQARSHGALRTVTRGDETAVVFDHPGQRRHPDGDAPVAGQWLGREVVAVVDRLATWSGRNCPLARGGAVSVTAGHEHPDHIDQHNRDDDGDHPAAQGPELRPLGVQQLREPVAPGRLRRPVRSDGRDHRTFSSAG